MCAAGILRYWRMEEVVIINIYQHTHTLRNYIVYSTNHLNIVPKLTTPTLNP